MPKRSAGLLLYRIVGDAIEVLIAHPGGPYWAHKDDGAWSIPKGEYVGGEDPWHAARREFAEEVGAAAPDGPRIDLGESRQSGGKTVTAFAIHADLDVPAESRSNTFEMEWPPRSGRVCRFPEVDRIEWCGLAQARSRLVAGQRVFLDRLVAHPGLAGTMPE